MHEARSSHVSDVCLGLLGNIYCAVWWWLCALERGWGVTIYFTFLKFLFKFFFNALLCCVLVYFVCCKALFQAWHRLIAPKQILCVFPKMLLWDH